MNRGLGKHLEGWQAGLLAVLVAGVVAVLVVPRHVEPTELPLPRVAPRDVATLRASWDGAPSRLERPDVPGSVRALAGRLRVYGRAEFDGEVKRVDALRADVVEASRSAFRDSPEDVVALEGLYAGAFVRAAGRWTVRGEITDDLAELGGDAPQAFAARGWKPDRGHVPEDFDVVLRALYRKRFVALVGDHPSLAPPPAEALVLLRFLMARAPETASGQASLFKQIGEVEGLDPTYPAELARGIVLYKSGRYEAAAASFDAFIARGSGAYQGRATNYLRAAVEEAAP